MAGLAALGATPVLFPAIGIAPPADTTSLDAALHAVEQYEWIVFTSANAVHAVLARLDGLGRTADALRQTRVAAVGGVTADVLRAAGLRVAVVSPDGMARGIPDALGDVAALRILLPRADLAQAEFPAELRRRGAQVDDVVAYRTVPGTGCTALAEAVRDGELDAITFASPSAVRYFVDAAHAVLDLAAALAAPGRPRMVCIGPLTATTARELGLRVDGVADEHDADGLLRAVVAALEETHDDSAHDG